MARNSVNKRGGSNRGRGGSNRGRGGRSNHRAPFKSRDRQKSYTQIRAAKRKYEQAHETDNKKIKDEILEEDVKLSSDSEAEDEPMDSYSQVMHSFGANHNSALDSGEEYQDHCDDSSHHDDDDEEDDAEFSKLRANVEQYKEDDSQGENESDVEDEKRDAQEEEESNNEVTDASDDDDDDDDVIEEAAPSSDDPFCVHFERDLTDAVAEQLRDSSNWTQECLLWPNFASLKHRYPVLGAPLNNNKTKKLLAQQPQPVISPPIPKPDESFDMSSLFIKNTIIKNATNDGLSDLQKKFLSLMINYTDVFYPEATYDKWDEITKVYCIHAANHILKTRARIMKNNAKLNKAMHNNKEVDMDNFRDQGYTRAKVLFLLPSRHSAYRVVQGLRSVLGLTGNKDIINKNRFDEEFGPGEQSSDNSRAKKNKAPDFVATFTGDITDDFKIGLTLNKRSMKLYTGFYSSDVIIASPLGLRLTTGLEGEQDNDAGFLTSIEILIMDQADMFLMQNWSHVLSVWESINSAISNVSEINSDVARVRGCVVAGHSPLYRQTLLTASVLTDQHRALFAHCNNFAGNVQLWQSSSEGVMGEVMASAELVLLRAPCASEEDARLQYFIKEFMPQHVASRKAYTLLYFPDYSDYFVVNQYLSQERDIAFSSINEYMTEKMSHVAVARSDFYKGKSPLLLYTERFHYYKRPVIKGIRHLVFYSLPIYPHFFTELCNMMLVCKQNSAASQEQKLIRPSISVIYQNSDVTKLSAVIGSNNTNELLVTDKRVHMCTITNT